MEEILAALLEKGLPFAMLGIAILYFRDLVKSKDGTIDKLLSEKDALHKELRAVLENSLNKSNDAINNNTVAFNALREAFLKNA